jgi:hypothetical protein
LFPGLITLFLREGEVDAPIQGVMRSLLPVATELVNRRPKIVVNGERYSAEYFERLILWHVIGYGMKASRQLIREITICVPGRMSKNIVKVIY